MRLQFHLSIAKIKQTVLELSVENTKELVPEKPEAEKPEAEKPEAEKPEAGKPEAGKPEAGKPEAEKPEAGKPEAGKPEAGKPEAEKPTINSPVTGISQNYISILGLILITIGGLKYKKNHPTNN